MILENIKARLLLNIYFAHEHIIEGYWQLIRHSKNVLDSTIILICHGEIKRQSEIGYLNLLFTKCLIQTFRLNHYERFDFHESKVLEY